MIRRREFVAALGGAAALWPFAAHAQQGNRMRRVGVLTVYDENDALLKARISAFTQELADSAASRTVIPMHRGQRSGDCGQLPMSV
jgi:hypothetical protein